MTRTMTKRTLANRANALRARARRKLADAERLLDRADHLHGRPKPAAEPPPPVRVPVSRIDPTPAASVRAGDPDRQAVERYKRAGLAALAPVMLFAYPDPDAPDALLYLMGEGGHRLMAAEEAAADTGREAFVYAVVERFPDVAEAERAAFACAFAANRTHGVPRSEADATAAVDTALCRLENERLSDRKVAELCRVHHPFVRTRRKALSASGHIRPDSKAHAGRQGYKDDLPADDRPLTRLGKLPPAVCKALRVAGAKTVGDVSMLLARKGTLFGLAACQRADLERRLARAAKTKHPAA